MRARLACVAAMAIIVASCGASTPPSPTAPGSATPSPRVVPIAATPAVVGHWETAGTMTIGRFAPHAVPLADGSTLVVGNDACGRDSLAAAARTAFATTASPPRRGTHRPTAGRRSRASTSLAPTSLPCPSLTAGSSSRAGSMRASRMGYPDDHQSYSSTYIYDPRTPGRRLDQGGPSGQRPDGSARGRPARRSGARGRRLLPERRDRPHRHRR